ncbi:hypothetical protein F5887DRAFT_357886 [Amanita rubescens]|nr:hypothetical protein F5887DRAFT_357886 [Amanita rubescens]
MLGISVVAIPISPMISDISPRTNGESEGQTPSGQHSLHDTSHHHGGNAQHEKQEDGLWTAYHHEYNSMKRKTYYLKIVKGAIVGLWPMPYKKEVAEDLFTNKNWSRETTLGSLRRLIEPKLPEEMVQGFETNTFPRGSLRTESIVDADGHPVSLKAKIRSGGSAEEDVNVGIHVPLWSEKKPDTPAEPAPQRRPWE